MRAGYLVVLTVLMVLFCGANMDAAYGAAASAKARLEFIHVGKDGRHFVCGDSNSRFVVWGFNYDSDYKGRLIEDYWDKEWATVAQDFGEMKAYGANVVRIILQFGKFMDSPTEPNQKNLRQLARLCGLAEKTGIYVDLTGLGCFHKNDVPVWYSQLSEKQRWDAQARFWEAVAKTCKDSPAVFCYDLTNEPFVAKGGKENNKDGYLAGLMAGTYFSQKISIEPNGRTNEQIAKAWVDQLSAAIRKVDKRHMVTVGLIPLTRYFKGASGNLDYISIHIYPKSGNLENSVKLLDIFDVGKPIVAEEFFPLNCSVKECGDFVNASLGKCQGWISMYDGRTIEEIADANAVKNDPNGGKVDPDVAASEKLWKDWLKYWVKKAPEITKDNCR